MGIKERILTSWPYVALKEEITLSPDAIQARSSQIFTEAKQLSDFIGMIVRLSFVIFALNFFLVGAPNVGGVTSYVFGFCAVTALGLTINLANKIMKIIYFWEIRDITVSENSYIKVFFMLFALTSTLIGYVGIFKLARTIATANPLISAR